MEHAPQPGGYIFLWRSLVHNGHLHMPEIPFKLFIYLLLQVNRMPANGCDVGEGWITYRMIKEACCKPDKQWADSTISRALDYLEGNNHDGPGGQPEVYIQRIQTKKGGPQKIRVVNFCKYQVLTSSSVQEVTGRTSSPAQEVTATSSFLQEVRNHSSDAGLRETSCIKQEVNDGQPLALALEKQEIDMKKKRKRRERDLQEIPDELRDDWMRFYEALMLRPPSLEYIKAFSRYINERGVTDRLVSAVIEKGYRLKRRNILGWASTILAELAAFGVKTVEEWEAFEAEREAETAKRGKRRSSSWEPREVHVIDEFERKRRQQHDVQ